MSSTSPFTTVSSPVDPSVSASGTSSSDSPSVAPEHPSSSTILFAFLIIFLSLFGFFVVSAIVWHHVLSWRRGSTFAIPTSADDGVRPEVWDVWTDIMTGKELVEGERGWDDVLPLAARKQNSAGPIASTSTSKGLPAQRVKGRLLLPRPFRRVPPSPSFVSIVDLPSPKPSDVQVAMLIAMPSPPTSPDKYTRDEELREYVIGTTYTSYCDSDTISATPP